jgi:hypothetical protein
MNPTSRFASGHPLPFPASFREEAGGASASDASSRSFMCGGFFADDKIAASVRSRGLCGPRPYIHRGTRSGCH